MTPVNQRPWRHQVTALILAGIFPGLGQFYNRQPVKGSAFVVVAAPLGWVAGRAFPADLLTLAESRGTLLLPLLALLGIWFWSIIDA
jgi:hypothetical protein